MGILILKILMTPVAALDMLTRMVYGFMMWDARPLEQDTLLDMLWKNKK
jgi:hypothetical protein